MPPKTNIHKSFTIQIESNLVWHVDGSNTDRGAEAGIYSENLRCYLFVSVGIQTTVVQAEIHGQELTAGKIRKDCRGKALAKNGPAANFMGSTISKTLVRSVIK